MSKINFQQVSFLTSAANISTLEKNNSLEIAFVGRSNAGKSSTINSLCKQKSLARTSKTPGRTQLINLFKISDNFTLVDLPGYGYADVPLKVKLAWQKSLSEYLIKRDNLIALVLLMDIRRPLTDLDQNMIQWCAERKLPVILLLTKADKLSKAQQIKMQRDVEEAIIAFNTPMQVLTISNLKKSGIEKLEQVITEHYYKNLPSESDSPEESNQQE